MSSGDPTQQASSPDPNAGSSLPDAPHTQMAGPSTIRHAPLTSDTFQDFDTEGVSPESLTFAHSGPQGSDLYSESPREQFPSPVEPSDTEVQPSLLDRLSKKIAPAEISTPRTVSELVQRSDSYPSTEDAGQTLPVAPRGVEKNEQGYATTTRPLQRPADSRGHMSFYDAREHMKSGGERYGGRHYGVLESSENSPNRRLSIGDPGAGYQLPRTPRELEEGRPLKPRESTPPETGKQPKPMSRIRVHLVATLGEFVGTTMFLVFAFAGTELANSQTPTNTSETGVNGFNIQKLLYISLSFGFSLMVNVWIFFRISGGLFNPCVTLAFFLTGVIPGTRAVLFLFAQIAGGIAASALVLALFPAELAIGTSLNPLVSITQGVFIEAFMTAELIFTILMLAKEKTEATFLAPVGIGLAIFIAELIGVFWTGGSLNPARSFGPAVVAWKWEKTHWIYWVGPIIGTLLAVGLYILIKLFEHDMVDPGPDADEKNDLYGKEGPRHATRRAPIAAGRSENVENVGWQDQAGAAAANLDYTQGHGSGRHEYRDLRSSRGHSEGETVTEGNDGDETMMIRII